MCRHCHHGEFRNMRVLRHQPGDAAEPEAGAETIDQVGKFNAVIGRG
jgi:hypothetical protein